MEAVDRRIDARWQVPSDQLVHRDERLEGSVELPAAVLGSPHHARLLQLLSRVEESGGDGNALQSGPKRTDRGPALDGSTVVVDRPNEAEDAGGGHDAEQYQKGALPRRSVVSHAVGATVR